MTSKMKLKKDLKKWKNSFQKEKLWHYDLNKIWKIRHLGKMEKRLKQKKRVEAKIEKKDSAEWEACRKK